MALFSKRINYIRVIPIGSAIEAPQPKPEVPDELFQCQAVNICIAKGSRSERLCP